MLHGQLCCLATVVAAVSKCCLRSDHAHIDVLASAVMVDGVGAPRGAIVGFICSHAFAAAIAHSNTLFMKPCYQSRRLYCVQSIDSSPVATIVLQDEIVPPEQMHLLHSNAKAAAADVTMVEFPDAHHMDAYDASPLHYWAAVQAFMNAHVET